MCVVDVKSVFSAVFCLSVNAAAECRRASVSVHTEGQSVYGGSELLNLNSNGG